MTQIVRRGAFVGAWLALVTFAGSACGYALAGHGSFLPAYIKSIGVTEFVNNTSVFNLETLLSRKVRSELIGRGKYKIVASPDSVDALLTVQIISSTLTPTSFDQFQVATVYAISFTAKVEFRDLHDNRVLWDNPAMVFRESYEAKSGRNALDPAAFFGQDANALERMSDEVARQLVSSILDAF